MICVTQAWGNITLHDLIIANSLKWFSFTAVTQEDAYTIPEYKEV